MSCIAIKQSNGDQAVAIICFNSDQVDQHNHWQAGVSGGMVIPARLDCRRTIVTDAETDISEYFWVFLRIFEYSWVFLGVLGYFGVFLGIFKYCWVFLGNLGIFGYFWV